MRIIPKKKSNEKSLLDISISASNKNFPFSFNDLNNKKLFKERFFTYIFFGWIFSIILQVALIILSWNKLPQLIPLFYSLPWGQSILVKPIFAWTFPAFTAIWGILDFLLIRKSNDKFINRILVITVALVSFLNIVGLTKIISLLI